MVNDYDCLIPIRMELSGAKKIRSSSVTKELPEELIRTEILARLPLKSLARFKSVCKLWLSVLSSDPQFIKELDRRNPDDYDCIVANNSDHIVILSRYREIFTLHGDHLYKLIGSANGLVCVTRGKKVSLWNPAIFQCKEFDLPPLCYLGMDKIGFGFYPVSNDYKVVVLCKSYSLSNLNCVVYSSSSGTWIAQSQPGYEIVMSKFTRSLTPTTMVKDCPYWTCSTRDKNITSLATLKFDATSSSCWLSFPVM
ncbi:putative F-box protein At3g10240 [Apium graveolens]|uniref:putative F-box protein At3g10240 n=1 Tax=Apium graveolens TaxID=4045 RepID=UPI003D799D69